MFFRSLITGAALVLLTSPFFPAKAAVATCLKCHAAVQKEKVLHGALGMGCTSCHAMIDAARVPHRRTGDLPKGLTAEQPDLCYACHEKGMFTRKNVHAAIGMGCTGCHGAHGAKNAKLLSAEVPDLCFACHDRSLFSQKTVHAPVAGGMCLSCHDPHSSDEMALLIKKPYDLCLDCHSEVPKRKHAVSGFSSRGHPLGEAMISKTGLERTRKDPARPDRPFYCGSCHDPHSTNAGRLFRFNAKTGMGLCSNCHKRQ